MGFKLVWDVPFHFDPFWIWPFEQLPQLASLKEPRYSRVPVFPWSTFALFLRADETSLSCFFAQPAGVCQFKRTVAVTTPQTLMPQVLWLIQDLSNRPGAQTDGPDAACG